MHEVMVTGSFDNLLSQHVRFLEEASKLGKVNVALWSDETVQAQEGHPPRFPQQERAYLLQSLRFVERVTWVRNPDYREEILFHFRNRFPQWVVSPESDSPGQRAFAASLGIHYHVIPTDDLQGFAVPPYQAPASGAGRRRVVVTGCYDWFHSGHVRFFEEASALGDLYVVVGHDTNIRLLKGGGHPLLPQTERLYMVAAVRFVHQALISTGHGWMDAEPEITSIQPHFYVVNEDGDKPEKRQFCAEHGIEYVVLKRAPKPGLPRRESTALRGF